jgi:hypothetical protein
MISLTKLRQYISEIRDETKQDIIDMREQKKDMNSFRAGHTMGVYETCSGLLAMIKGSIKIDDEIS